MTLLAQHGWGKSDKIERGIAAGALSGVVLSPRDEIPERLVAYVDSLQENDAELTVFLDPQLYAATVLNPRAGRLPEYPYFAAELTYRDFVRASAISRRVRRVIDYQLTLGVSHICTPVIGFDSFGDRWNSVALSMAAESISYYASAGDDRPLLVSLLINENAFRPGPHFEEFLDIITDFECEGFYVLLRRDDNEHRQTIEPEALSAMLYMTHVLGTLNAFEVFFGYSGFLSMPLHAAGATACACGWSLGLRRFSFGRFEQSTGGRRPRDRYSSLPLLNSLFVIPELDQIEQAGMLGNVLTGTDYDGVLNTRPPSSAQWPSDIAALHHWQTIAAGIMEVTADPTPRDRLDRLSDMISGSIELYDDLEAEGCRLDGPSSKAHLGQWNSAVDEFRDLAGV